MVRFFCTFCGALGGLGLGTTRHVFLRSIGSTGECSGRSGIAG